MLDLPTIKTDFLFDNSQDDKSFWCDGVDTHERILSFH